MEGYNVPGILLIPAIILEFAAPILIIVGYKTKIAAFLLAAFCMTTALIFHTDFSNQMQVTSFLKNVGLAGGFLFIIFLSSLRLPNVIQPITLLEIIRL